MVCRGKRMTVSGLRVICVVGELMREECILGDLDDVVSDDCDLEEVIRPEWTQAGWHRCRDAGVVVLSFPAESGWVEPS